MRITTGFMLVLGLAVCLSTSTVPTSSYATENANGPSLDDILRSMESPAEDMLDAIDSKDTALIARLRKGLYVQMVELNQRATVMAPPHEQAHKIALLNSWFALVSLETKELDDLPALAFAANQFSGQLISATDYRHDYEKQIAWMDYLGRELWLLNKYPSGSDSYPELVKTRTTDLQRTWRSVRAAMSDTPEAEALIDRVDSAVQATTHESDHARLVAISSDLLDLVDELEEHFHIY